MASRFVAGEYLERITWLHGVAAGAKIAALLALTVACFVAGGRGVALLAVAAAMAALSCGVRVRDLLRALRPAAVVLAFALVANALRLDGTADVLLLGPVGFSAAGAVRGVVAVARIATIVALVLLVSATTTVTALTDALSRAFAPLGTLGLPAGDLAMVVAVTLRLVPAVGAEYQKIVDAQRARGALFGRGGVRTRLAAWSAVLVPLVLALFRASDQLAQAMADRWYKGGLPLPERTPLSARSVALLAATLALAVASVIV